MASPLGRHALVPCCLAASLLLGGCTPWWQQQERQQRQALEQCLDRRERLQQVQQQLDADQSALASLAAERYQPTPQPQAPDPDLASRFSQLDQLLDQERYADQLDAWRQREQPRQQRWQNNQRQRSQRVQQRLDTRLQQLKAIDPALVTATGADRAAMARLQRCPAKP